jgi:hypothetical protein
MHGENCLSNKLSDLCHNALSLHSGLSFLAESSDRLRSPEMEQTMEEGMYRKLQFWIYFTICLLPSWDFKPFWLNVTRQRNKFCSFNNGFM